MEKPTNEAYFRQLMDSLPQMVWTADAAGVVDYNNARWYEYTGINPESSHGYAWLDLVHPSHRELVLDRWSHAIATGGLYDVEILFRRAQDREYRWMLIRANPILGSDGKVVRWIGSNTDIHEQKSANDRRAMAQERLDLALRASHIGFYDWNISENYVLISDEMKADWGIDHDFASLEEALALIHPDDRVRVQAAIEASVTSDQPYEIEYRVVRPRDGETVWVDVKGEVLKDAEGVPNRFVGTSLNITARKEAEDALKAAKNAAEAANRMKSAFLANMSHEIRTPLGAILGFAELLKDERLDGPERANYLGIITRNGEHLSAILSDILDLSKIEAGQMKPEIVICSLRSLLNEVCAPLALKASEKGLKFGWYADATVPALIATDPVRLRQILSNVAGNAVKFTANGSIDVQASAAGEMVTISVTDTGVGLSAEQSELLFKPFSQADESITRRFGGTGLGLALSRRLAAALGGNLVLKSSRPGVGSVFEITIKDAGVKNASEVPGGDPGARSETGLNGLRVLLVEDCPDNQMLVERMLAPYGIELELADNGREGIERASNGSHDLVLMDIQMPEVDGFSATKTLRANGYQKPIIAVTAHALTEVRQKCLEFGCSDYLSKPLRKGDLATAIARHTGRMA